MRKHCKRTVRRQVAPTLVAYLLNPEVSTQERLSVVAIRSGYATTAHFDVLADCRDMLALAAAEKNDSQTMTICELGFIALQNIKERYLERQRIGASGDELQALQALVDISEDFWKRQSGALFIDAEAALGKARAEYRERKAA
ncbi:MAG: hypothetical protein CVU31_02655 [Betaproteobacteria bacterium HGW-Betaproteobacteria-4]|jgi:hypothetical protein|nr:MAG: hypothetical protein CVU31_02655 [Betaproteobacteria bacterium HGW-Betaproteobacteria-4]